MGQEMPCTLILMPSALYLHPKGQTKLLLATHGAHPAFP